MTEFSTETWSTTPLNGTPKMERLIFNGQVVFIIDDQRVTEQRWYAEAILTRLRAIEKAIEKSNLI